eukprot:CAMPEP_0202948522 /NCGR_PEP_ID=MMETSP1395-20130829/13610_1 /ASSEMBLY_ACC=CAM_ASM_000871 /TAXON_ID=5961 /ORGANISM="Blepharisma japonicum, Strain Stock R1072" /LENGTH=296 /DNA_ID=CAMNT_0049650655 /DNA_START=86 /DNA_END=976 /DNA_ORIENTATION=+
MAVQLNIAFSADSVGAGLIAGAPYYCAQGSAVTASTACLNAGYLINTEALVQYTKDQASAGNIDNVVNVATDHVWIFAGAKDEVVNQSVGRKLYAYYQSLMDNHRINATFDQQANFAWITSNEGNPCWYYGAPFINNCQLDAAGLLLKSIYGTLQPAVSQNFANLYQFPQHEFVSNSSAGMDTFGWIYQPAYCIENACKVHVALHGCNQNYDAVGAVFIKNNGLNGWAEANNIVVIYPQVLPQSQINSDGCWDWWGYTGPNYALKSGIQMAGIYNLTQSLEVITSFRPGQISLTKE